MNDKKLVLIIEDSPLFAKTLKNIIEKKNPDYDILIEYDGEAGYKSINEKNPDLVILDINLPKMSGFEVFKKISDDSGKPRFPVLVLTTRGELEDIFDNMGAEGFFEKSAPFDINAFLGEIERIILKREKPYVFLIDDITKPHISELRTALKKSGYKVINIDGMDMFKRATIAHRPDFILIEYSRQNVQGDAFLKELGCFIKKLKDLSKKQGLDTELLSKLWPKNHKAPIIVYTYAETNHEKESMELGASAYIQKPKSVETITSKLNEFRFNINGKSSQENEALNKLLAIAKPGSRPKLSDLDIFSSDSSTS